MENEKLKNIGAARAEINPHPGLDPGSPADNTDEIAARWPQ